MAPWTANDGTTLLLRPIRPEDEPLLVAFHGTLSERTVALRYFHAMKLSSRVAHERLTRICFVDYDREMVLVAERHGSRGRRRPRDPGRRPAEQAPRHRRRRVRPADHQTGFQKRGLGTALLARLIAIARDEGIRRIVGSILPENLGMHGSARSWAFGLSHDVEDGVVKAEMVP